MTAMSSVAGWAILEMARRLRKAGLSTLMQTKVFADVVDCNGGRSVDIAERLNMSAGALSAARVRLVELGLLEEVKDASDMRVTRLRPSEKGVRLAQEICEITGRETQA